jgi:hypothetical protein
VDHHALTACKNSMMLVEGSGSLSTNWATSEIASLHCICRLLRLLRDIKAYIKNNINMTEQKHLTLFWIYLVQSAKTLYQPAALLFPLL